MKTSGCSVCERFIESDEPTVWYWSAAYCEMCFQTVKQKEEQVVLARQNANQKHWHKMKHDIEKIDMSIRLRTCLRKHGIKYLEEVYDYTDDDYFQIRNIGRRCIHEAHEIVRRYRILDTTHEK